MIRAWLGIGAVTLLSLWGSVQFYSIVASASRSDQDVYRIGVHLERWADVRNIVPEGAVVGYVSDLGHENLAGAAAFLAAQYALAPRLLVDLKPGRPVRWVVGVFSKPADFQEVQRGYGLRLVRDFRDGRALFEKVTH